MKVYSLYSSYLNVLIKTLQLQAKVENIKNAEIRKLALFQWGGAISPACRRLFQWSSQSPSLPLGRMQLARVLERAASAVRLPLLPSRLHAGKPVWSAIAPASWQAHAPPAHTHPRCSAILLGRSGATVAAKHNLQRELVCARTRHCAHHGREWARAKRSNGRRHSPIVGQRGKREGEGKEEAAPHAPENR